MSSPLHTVPRFSRRAVLAAGAASPLLVSFPGQAVAAGETCCPIVELRQYTLHPGMRDRFIELFQREFIESQEAAGITMIGLFRDLDDPDRYVWLRGFPDMDSRAAALTAFYGGDLWKQFRNEANASINDSDNVLLLRLPRAQAGFAKSGMAPPARGVRNAPHGVVIAVLHYLDDAQMDAFAAFFEDRMRPRIERQGLPVHAYFVTERSPNTFPRLPVREKERVLVWFSGAPDLAAANGKLSELWAAQTWRDGASDPILHQLERKPEILRLQPLDRSALRF